jgi:microcompartment protein CcmK/EutM
MILARVVGTIVATRKDAALKGQRLLIVQPVTPELKETGKRIAVLDAVGIWMEGIAAIR